MFDEREKRKDTNNRGMIIIIEASMATIFFFCVRLQTEQTENEH